MTDPDLADYDAAFLEKLPLEELQRERAYLFRAIPHHLRCKHHRELREAQLKLIAVTAAMKAQRQQKENPAS